MPREIFDYNKVSVDTRYYTPSTAQTKVRSYKEDIQGDTGLGETVKDFEFSTYDDPRLLLTDLYNPDPMRAGNQGALTKLGLSIGRGLTKGVLGFGEYAGYLLDAQEWLGADTDEVDAAYTNWFSELMKDAKEGVDDIAPIYRKNPGELFDGDDIAGTVASGLDGLVDSAVSFGLLGLAITATGGAAAGLLPAAFASSATGMALGRVGVAALTNYAESKMMATELINNARKDLETGLNKQLEEGKITNVEFERQLQDGLTKAADEADKFIWRNKLNMWQDFAALRSLSGATAGTRAADALFKGTGSKLKNAATDALGESFEEISSGALQAEGEYAVKKSTGQDVSEYQSSALDRALDYASSEQGIYEGVLGALGGPVQSYMVNKPIEKFVTKSSYNDRVAREKTQKEFAAKNKEGILNFAAKQKDISTRVDEALAAGDIQAAEDIHAESFADLAFNNFKNGTTTQLEQSLKELLESDQTLDSHKPFIQQYLTNLSSYEDMYIDIFNRRAKETKAKTTTEFDAVLNQALVAEEFKLKVLRKTAENQLGKINSEVEALQKDVNVKSLAKTQQVMDAAQQDINVKWAELTSVRNLLKRKDLDEETAKSLKAREQALKSTIKEKEKEFKAARIEVANYDSISKELQDKLNKLVDTKVQYETSIQVYDNKVDSLLKNKMTPNILKTLVKADSAAKRVANKSKTVDPEEVAQKAAEDALSTADPALTDLEKEKLVIEAAETKRKELEAYTDSTLKSIDEVVNSNTSTDQKILKLRALQAELNNRGENYAMSPDKTATKETNIFDYLTNRLEELALAEAEESTKKLNTPKTTVDPPENSTPGKPIVTQPGSFNIKLPWYFNQTTNAATKNGSLVSTFEGLTFYTPEEVTEIMTSLTPEELNNNVTLHVQAPTNQKQNPSVNKIPGTDLYTSAGMIRYEIAVVYNGKILGMIYEPNQVVRITADKTTPVDITTLSDKDIRAFYPEGDIQALKDGFAQTQSLINSIAPLMDKSTKDAVVFSNATLKEFGFELSSLRPDYDVLANAKDWYPITDMPASEVKFPDGSKGQVIAVMDKSGVRYLSTDRSQLNSLVKTLPNPEPSMALKNKYLSLAQLPNGEYVWVPLVESPYANMDNLFKAIQDFVLDYNSNKAIDYKEISKVFNDLFISSVKGEFDIRFDFSEDALRVQIFRKDFNSKTTIKIFPKEFKNISSMDELITAINSKMTAYATSMAKDPTNPLYADKVSLVYEGTNNILQLDKNRFRTKLPANIIDGNSNLSKENVSKYFYSRLGKGVFTGTRNIKFNAAINEVTPKVPVAVIDEPVITYDSADPFAGAAVEPNETALTGEAPQFEEPSFDDAPENRVVITVKPPVIETVSSDNLTDLEAKLAATKNPLERAKLQQEINNIKRAQATDIEGSNGPVFSTKALPAKSTINMNAAKTWLSSILPDSISTQEMNDVLMRLNTNGVAFGAFMDSVIYLSKNAEKGTEYHEAFHAVFRTLLNDNEIAELLALAKKRFKAPTNDDLIKLRASSIYTLNLSTEELTDLFYEEAMADKMQEMLLGKNQTNWLGKLYNKIKSWLRFITGRQDEFDSFVSKIDKGFYKNGAQVANRYTRGQAAYKLLYNGVNEDNTLSVASADLSNKVIYTTAAKVGTLGIQATMDDVDKILDEMATQYDLSKPDTYQKYSALFEGKSEVEQNDLALKLTQYFEVYSNPENRSIIKASVKSLLKTFSAESTEEELAEANAEGVSERFDVDLFTLGGFDSMSAPVKTFIGLTLYEDVDPFGNPIEVGVDALKVYNGITAATSNSQSDQEILHKLKLFAKDNVQTKAVWDKFVKAVSLEFNQDGTYTFDKSQLNTFNVFLNAFKKDKVSFWTVLADGGRRNIIESNRKSSKQIQANKWAGNFTATFNAIKEGLDTESKSRIFKAINDAAALFDESKKTYDALMLENDGKALKKHMLELGIEISQGYAEQSLAYNNYKRYPELASKEVIDRVKLYSKNLSSDNYINNTQLFLFKELLSKGQNIYAKEATSEQTKRDANNKSKFKTNSYGAYTRILKISEGNTYFDENVIESTFTNAENKKVYNYLQRNHLTVRAGELRNESLRNDLNQDKFISGNNHLLNFEHTNDLFDNLSIGLIDGSRQANLTTEENEELVKTQEGTTFGSMSSSQYLDTILSFFANQTEVKDPTDATKSLYTTAKYIFRQVESSNTGVVMDLPIFDYVTISPTGTLEFKPEFSKHLKGYVTQEWDRIGREWADRNNPDRDIYEGYNKKEKDRAYSFWNFPILNGNITGVNDFHVQAREGNLLDSDTLADIFKAIEINIQYEFKELTKILEAENIYREDAPGKKGINNLPEHQYGDNHKLFLGQFFANDFMNSLGINQLYDGDYALARKDFVDMVKRHKGSNGYGPDMGDGVTNIAIIHDPVKFVKPDTLEDKFSSQEDDSAFMAQVVEMEAQRIAEEQGISIDDAKKQVDIDALEIKTADAQSYVTVEHVIAQLKTLGRYDKQVRNIYEKSILKGIPLTFNEVTILESKRAALNSRKTVIFDGAHYYKMSEIPISLELANDPKFKWHKNLLDSMNKSGIDQAVFLSGSKGASKNVVPFSEEGAFDFSKSNNSISNKYKRLQVETPSGKQKITAGTQLINLIVAELDYDNGDAKVNFLGQDITLKELRNTYYNLLADVRNIEFKAAKEFLIDVNGNKDPKKAAKKFLETVQDSGGSELLIRYFSTNTDGTPKYNWNLAPIIDKAEELFLAHFNKEYSVQKVEGTKAYLVSDVGVTKEDGTKLKWGIREGDKVFSECLIPPFLAELYDLKPGDPIPAEASEMLGVRIPTQDKHSMVTLKVAGFLPAAYGSVIILPKEVVLLAGSDFDIDSLYISRYKVYKNAEGKLTRYGTAKTIEDKYKEYLTYKLSDPKSEVNRIKKEYADKNEAEILKQLGLKTRNSKNADGVKSFRPYLDSLNPMFLKMANMPSTLEEFIAYTDNGKKEVNKAVLDNQILETQILMYSHESIQDKIAKTPATIDPLKKISKSISDLRSQASTAVNFSGFNGYSAVGRYYAFVNNTEGKQNIGPTALTNVANAELTTHKIESIYKSLILNGDATGSEDKFFTGEAMMLYINDNPITGFASTLDTKGERKADSLSTILSAMTDNAKDPLAALINLGLDIIPVVNHAVTQGIDLESAVLMVNNPDVLNTAKDMKLAKNAGNPSKLGAALSSKLVDVVAEATKYIESAKLKDIPLSAQNLSLTKEEFISKLKAPALNKSEASITTERLRFLVKTNPKTFLASNATVEEKIQYFVDRALVIKSLVGLYNQQEFIRHFTTLQSLYKGTDVSFDDCERFVDAMNATQVYKYFTDKKLSKKFEPGGSLHKVVDTSKMYDLDPVFSNNKSLVQLAEKTAEILTNISEQYFISRTPKFIQALATLRSSLITNKESRVASLGQLFSYIGTTAFKRAVAENPNSPFHDLMISMGTGDSLGGMFVSDKDVVTAKLVRETKAKLFRENRSNYLLNMLAVEFDDLTGLYTIAYPSMSKFSDYQNNKLVDSFNELYRNEETRELAKRLFLNLFFKDNFRFKKDSYINQAPEFLFREFSAALDIVQEQFSDDTVDGVPYIHKEGLRLMTLNFAEMFLTYVDNQFYLQSFQDRYNKNSPLFDKIIANNLPGITLNKATNVLTIEVEKIGPLFTDSDLKLDKKLRRDLRKLLTLDKDNNVQGILAFISGHAPDKNYVYVRTKNTDGVIQYTRSPLVGISKVSPYAFKYAARVEMADRRRKRIQELKEKGAMSKVLKKSGDAVIEDINFTVAGNPVAEAVSAEPNFGYGEPDFEAARAAGLPINIPVSNGVIINPGMTKEGKSIENIEKINIYYKAKESPTNTRILSNLAERRFIYNGIEYGSVEHAYQSLKSGTFDENTYNKYNSLQTKGYGEKIQGKPADKTTNLKLMETLVIESILQNKDNNQLIDMLIKYKSFTHNTNELIDQVFLQSLLKAREIILNSTRSFANASAENEAQADQANNLPPDDSGEGKPVC